MSVSTQSDRTASAEIGARPRYSSWALTVGGIALIGMGLYFLLIRPPLLPEDPAYMETTLQHISATVPGLLNWLPKVFAVLGGYITSTGILTCYLAQTSLKNRAPGSLAIACLSGVTSIGLMVAVNFIIQSDFRWVLLMLATPWLATVLLYWRETAWTGTQAD
jgi:RsiW-degrading membrane proteinase PrsW (M82 family)